MNNISSDLINPIIIFPSSKLFHIADSKPYSPASTWPVMRTAMFNGPLKPLKRTNFQAIVLLRRLTAYFSFVDVNKRDSGLNA